MMRIITPIFPVAQLPVLVGDGQRGLPLNVPAAQGYCVEVFDFPTPYSGNDFTNAAGAYAGMKDFAYYKIILVTNCPNGKAVQLKNKSAYLQDTWLNADGSSYSIGDIETLRRRKIKSPNTLLEGIETTLTDGKWVVDITDGRTNTQMPLGAFWGGPAPGVGYSVDHNLNATLLGDSPDFVSPNPPTVLGTTNSKGQTLVREDISVRASYEAFVYSNTNLLAVVTWGFAVYISTSYASGVSPPRQVIQAVFVPDQPAIILPSDANNAIKPYTDRLNDVAHGK